MDIINKVSDFHKANMNSMQLYNKPLFLSSQMNKKYMIMNDNNKLVHFGDIRFEDFLKHGDYRRRSLYYKRSSKIKGHWIDNIYSPNMLSMRILWEIAM